MRETNLNLGLLLIVGLVFLIMPIQASAAISIDLPSQNLYARILEFRNVIQNGSQDGDLSTTDPSKGALGTEPMLYDEKNVGNQNLVYPSLSGGTAMAQLSGLAWYYVKYENPNNFSEDSLYLFMPAIDLESFVIKGAAIAYWFLAVEGLNRENFLKWSPSPSPPACLSVDQCPRGWGLANDAHVDSDLGSSAALPAWTMYATQTGLALGALADYTTALGLMLTKYPDYKDKTFQEIRAERSELCLTEACRTTYDNLNQELSKVSPINTNIFAADKTTLTSTGLLETFNLNSVTAKDFYRLLINYQRAVLNYWEKIS